MTDYEIDQLDSAMEALETLHAAASSYGMMTAGFMPLDSMRTDFFRSEHASFAEAIVSASKVLRSHQ